MRVRLNHKRLLELIAQSKLSQNHWAMRLGLSRGHWSGIVKGKHPYPSRKTRTVLLDAFGVSFEELFVHESHSGVDAEFQADLAERYLLEREIGQGGMGTVYLARDVRLARSVALKVVSSEAVSGIGADRFLKEIRFAARLQHPNILPVHDAGEAAGAPYYVMPLIEAGSLRRRLERDGPLDVPTAIRITTGVAEALAHAHDRQVLHCDVKPENILLAGDHAYVADFGIARAIHAEGAEWGRRGELDSSAGTPAYVSPEQASGEAALDARSDVYSLACMTYEMLTGTPPFDGRSTMETVAKRFVEIPRLGRLAPHVPRGVAAVVENAMSVHPDNRPASSAEFAAALQRAMRTPESPVWARLLIPFTRSAAVIRRGLPRTPRLIGKTMDSFRQDIKFAIRTFRRAPLISLVVVLTLALGIGINSAVFTVVSGVLLKPLPYEDGDQLVFAWSLIRRGATFDTVTVNPSDFTDWRSQSSTFTDMAAFNVWLPTVSGDRGAERVSAGIATPNFFDVVGVSPLMGTGFAAEHVGPENGRVVLLSFGFWQRWFGGDPDVLNRSLTINGEPHHVVGVMPPSYRHLDPSRQYGNADFWAPLSIEANATDRSSLYLRAIGRLRSGVTLSEAQAELSGIAAQLGQAYPATNSNRSVVVAGLRDYHYASVRPALMTILGAAGLVLLIICANIANLIMARSQARRREFAIRTSLGAGKTRLARQLIIEQTALTIPGALIGMAIVIAGTGALRAIQMQTFSQIAVVALDWRVFAFSVAVALTVGIAFGVLSVLELRRANVRELLAEETAGAGSSRTTHRFRTALVVSQIGLAAALLIAAGLLTRSFVNLVRVPTGFDIDNTMTFETSAPRWKYETAADAVPFFEQLSNDLAAIPGVGSVGMISDIPFTSENRFREFNRPVNPFPVEDAPPMEYHQIDDGYLAAAGIRLVSGRNFTAADHGGSIPVALLNQSAASMWWPAQDAVGNELVSSGEPDGPRVAIVGVVSDVLDDGFNARPEPRIYFPYLQMPITRMSYMVKSTVEPEVLASTIRERVRQADPEAPVSRLTTIEDLLAQSVTGERMAVRLAGWFSFLSVFLAAVGIYGLMAFVVGSRRRELGIRSALGAESRDVLRLVLWQCLRFTAIGLLVGLAIGAATTRLLSSLLFGVAPLDPLTFLATPVLLAGVALLASYLPARRASRIPPMVALRSD
jgi:putative ABC transport system permease protein